VRLRRTGKAEKAGVMEALIMGVVSGPEEQEEMRGRIDEILNILRIQNSILSQILPQSAKLSSQLQELSNLGNKLDVMSKSLDVIKDFVRVK
jgi:hypothetical protein